MRLLVVADIHYSLKQFDWLNLISAKFDLVVIAGDMLDIASTVDLNTQGLVVTKYLSKIQSNVPLLVSSGNHDVTAEDVNSERVAKWLEKSRRNGIHIDGDCYNVGNYRFTLCPWWDGPGVRGQIEEQLARDAVGAPENWIWVYHAPPQNRPVSWTGKTYFGDEYVGEWINKYQPQMVFSGHVHQAPFRSGGSWVDQIGRTHVFNAGCQMGPEPAFIIVDTEAQSAVWISQMGREQIRLDCPLVSREEMSQ